MGVSRKGSRLGGMTFLGYLLESGFFGRLYPINPQAKKIRGIHAYPNLSSLPEVSELAIVCVAAPHVPSVLEDCARNGPKHIHILTAGFKETRTEEDEKLEKRIASIANREALLIMGPPNCMGPYCPSSRLTAWGAIPGRAGYRGVISQSGGIAQ